MAHTYALTVIPREIVGKKTVQLRRQGLLPGIVYGYKVQKPLQIQVDRREFERIYRRAGATSLIDLQLDGTPMTRVFVQEVTRHPVSHELMHVDFMAVNLTQPITADVALVLTGEAPASRGEGMVLQTLETLHVRALPTHLPSNVEVDISGLEEVGQAIHVSDLTLPGDVEVLTDADATIVHIAALRAMPEEEEAATEAAEAEAEESGEAAAEAAEAEESSES
jgi:large subunit ribosomal protein L25